MLKTDGKIDLAVLNELSSRVVDAVRPLKIFLFGSAARGQMGPDSDIDLLVIVPDGVHCLKTTQYLYKKLFGFGWPVDILVTNPKTVERQKQNTGLIYHHILTEGKEIYAA